MTTSRFRTRAFLAPYALFAGLSALTVAACGDDEDSDDTTTIPGTGGSRPTGGRDAGGETSAGAGETGTGGTSGASTGGGNVGGASDAGAGGAAEGGAENGGSDGGASEGGTGAGGETDCSPQGEYECYPCAPKTNDQYLNQCNESECSPFDNTDRIPGFTGTLPDL